MPTMMSDNPSRMRRTILPLCFLEPKTIAQPIIGGVIAKTSGMAFAKTNKFILIGTNAL